MGMCSTVLEKKSNTPYKLCLKSIYKNLPVTNILLIKSILMVYFDYTPNLDIIHVFFGKY